MVETKTWLGTVHFENSAVLSFWKASYPIKCLVELSSVLTRSQANELCLDEDVAPRKQEKVGGMAENYLEWTAIAD